MSKIKLNSIEEAIEDIKKGKIVIVVDDEDRENEGDFVTAAQKCYPRYYKFYGTGRAWTYMCSTY
ncbi:MAG: 3,4-dihydroxy-2-butanone-4-phosphate synthase [Chitinophagales bacterium]